MRDKHLCTENDFYADSRKALKVQGGLLYLEIDNFFLKKINIHVRMN